MSGIYIPGMEMPQNGVIIVRPDGSAERYARDSIAFLDFPTESKRTIPVSDHGRLVDATEMFEYFGIEGQRSKRYKLGEKWELNGEEIRKVIAELPTVIPEERGV